jgi:CSLREA domain-containing protein
MTNTQTTTKTNHYFRVLVMLAVLAMMTSLLVASAARPAHASTTFFVNSVGDQSDAVTGGSCDVDPQAQGNQCTLRAAIQDANNTLGADQIDFSIAGTQVHTIFPQSPLPQINGQTSIDGYSQPGAAPNTLAQGDNAVINVELDGRSAGANVRGLLFAQASNSGVWGLAIDNFSGSGIEVDGGLGVRIEGNFIGTEPTGTVDRGNGGFGVLLAPAGASNNGGAHTVGGDEPSERNVISGNARDGVVISFSRSNVVQGNYIGTDKDGTDTLTNDDMGNSGSGVLIDRSGNNTIGGSAAGLGNVISNSDSRGVFIDASSDDKVLGNRIGTDRTGTKNLGNFLSGVEIRDSSNNAVGDGTAGGSNTVAFSGKEGVLIDGSSTANSVLSDSIFSNARLGINLQGGFEGASGVTANDPGDVDNGANGLQNRPVLSSAKTVSGTTTIVGKLSSAPSTTYRIQFFSNASGNEGKKLIGQKTITTDGSGDRSFTFQPAGKVAAGRTVTATATNASTHETSEFSAARTVVSA